MMIYSYIWLWWVYDKKVVQTEILFALHFFLRISMFQDEQIFDLNLQKLYVSPLFCLQLQGLGHESTFVLLALRVETSFVHIMIFITESTVERCFRISSFVCKNWTFSNAKVTSFRVIFLHWRKRTSKEQSLCFLFLWFVKIDASQ